MPTRVLVIEDNPANMELMCYLLRAFGYQPLTAGDGEEGVATALREAPDIVICDIHLPKLDGYHVAEKLKRDPEYRGIPLIAVTAMAMVGDHDKVLKAGFDGYITKPIDPELFVSQIESYLKPAQRAAARQAAEKVEIAPAAIPRPAIRGTILVLDDSPVNLDLIRSTLEPIGFAVLLANTTKEGIAFAKSSKPDLILSDMHMPEQTGLDFLRMIKADSNLRRVPFVFISSSVWGENERADAIALGVSKFILRPIEPHQLVAEIEECLKKKELD